MAKGKFQNKVVLVTGASQGLGKAIAANFAAAGAKVVVASRNENELKKLVEEIGKGGGEAEYLVFDVIVAEEVSRAVETVNTKFGGVDILINNVGIGSAKNFRQTTPADFDIVVNTNLKGPFFLTQGLVQKMKAGSSIIFLTSIHSESISLDPTYDGTKAAISNWTKNLAAELAGSGIRVNAIAPGHIDKETGKEPRDQKDVPLTGRAGLPVDIANAALFLADSDLARYITGQILVVDGGLSVWEETLAERL